ncbi:MAG: AmmeMemoRadiSam system protein B [Spirochaetales bacterium]|nr:AmmeMemoRadiSam system protein B [Spirochaetales bacterium]
MARQEIPNERIRASTVDGIFYPQEPERLREAVEGLLEKSPTVSLRAQSIVCPHAAFDYSGTIAATAFKACAGRPVELAVLIGPVHREPTDAVLLCESQAFQTPLGNVPVDQELTQALAEHARDFRYDEAPHLEEHCLEVLLPFLQVLHPQARILPLLLGSFSRGRVEALSEALWELTRDRLGTTLFVVSSNLSTFLPDRESGVQAEAILERIRAMDWEALVESPGRKRLVACGGACIAAILLLHRRIGGNAVVLDRGSSLPAGGDPKRVVQYAAVALTADES